MDVFEQHGCSIVQIVDNYHKLREDAEPDVFNTLLASIISIDVPVPLERMAMNPDTLLNDEEFVVAQHAQHQSSSNTSKQIDGKQRVYLWLHQDTTATYVQFTDISREFYPMLPAGPKNPHLFYLDTYIPWQQHRETSVLFAYVKQHGSRNKIASNIALKKGFVSYYWVETKSHFFGKVHEAIMQAKKEQKAKARNQIVSHIIDATMNTYESYHFSSQILQSIHINQYTVPNLDGLWKEQVSNLTRDHKMINVFRLQLIYIIYENVSKAIIDVSTIYHVVQTCFADAKFSFKSIRTSQQKTVAKAIYNSFISAVKSLFSTHRTRDISSKDYVLLYPIYNFFHYFGDHQLIFQNVKNKHDHHFTSDDSWSTLRLQEMLELDLYIASLHQCRRRYPLEYLVIRLCAIKRDIPLFRNCLIAISQSKDTTKIYNDLFTLQSSKKHIFNILGDDFDLWQELMLLIQPDMISTERQILDAFQTGLRQQIDAMNSNNTKLRKLGALIANFPKIFGVDVINIRSALLKNDKLTQCETVKTLKRNITLIISMVMPDPMDGSGLIYDELISWMMRLLQYDGARDTALSIFGRVFLVKDDRKVQIFKRAFHKSFTIKNSVYGRIIMYLDCPSFYEFPWLQSYFVGEELLREHDHKIASWTDQQTKVVQDLCMKYTTNQGHTMDRAIAVWNAIFDKLMQDMVYCMFLHFQHSKINSPLHLQLSTAITLFCLNMK
eukprot:81029_1